MSKQDLPTQLYIDAHLRRLTGQGVPYYISHRGNAAGGVILLKIVNILEGWHVRLLLRQRDIMSGELGWMRVFTDRDVEESEADAYIRRAVDRDPDLWVIEIEQKTFENPFEGKILEY